MSDAGDAYSRLAVVNDVNHAPIAHADSPLVSIRFELLSSRRTGVVSQSLDLGYGACKHVIGEIPKFLPRGRLHLDGIVTHADGRASLNRL